VGGWARKAPGVLAGPGDTAPSVNEPGSVSPSSDVSTSDQVRLTLPARPEFVRLARLVTAGLASRLGFSYDEVEDLRIAVDELCYLLVGAHGHEGDVVLTFSTSGQLLDVVGEGRPASDEPLSPFSERILDAVVESYEIQRTPQSVTFRVTSRHQDR